MDGTAGRSERNTEASRVGQTYQSRARSSDATRHQPGLHLPSQLAKSFRHGKMSAKPIATAPISLRARSGKCPTHNLSSPHLGLSHPNPPSSRRRISLAIVRVLKWISRSLSPSQLVDIDKREATVVRQEFKRHPLPNSTSVKEGNAIARFSTSPSVRLKVQVPLILQQSFFTRSATKLWNDNMEDNNVRSTGVFLGQWRSFRVSLAFVFITAAVGARSVPPSPHTARRWSHGNPSGSRRSSSRDGKATNGNIRGGP